MSLQKTGAKNTNKFRMFKYVNKKKGMLIEYFANLKDNIMHPEHTTTKFTAVIFTLDKIWLQCNMMFHLLNIFFDNLHQNLRKKLSELCLMSVVL